MYLRCADKGWLYNSVLTSYKFVSVVAASNSDGGRGSGEWSVGTLASDLPASSLARHNVGHSLIVRRRAKFGEHFEWPSDPRRRRALIQPIRGILAERQIELEQETADGEAQLRPRETKFIRQRMGLLG